MSSMNDDHTSTAGPPGHGPRPAPGGNRLARRARAAGLCLAVAGGSVLGALVAVPAVSNAQEATTSTTTPSAGTPAPSTDAPAAGQRGTRPADGTGDAGCDHGAADGTTTPAE
jgi:hypothetical protein